ncbi:NAD(+) diphosphatase [Croceicoccus sp. F390]|uniref:NAD(+) diphosphatase n=1 Tax=Croceicoccus esteveae TaxID=3075597 RepID=A0ABU2ZEG5_9SPHN|nr:NAD(+) diphosphatase [Croceicoccus sp. F390]MDT0574770.1 NAD(+) diphosphatase [Croceicoccus sp. F390]
MTDIKVLRLDRADHVRNDPSLLAAAASDGAIFLLLDGLTPRFDAAGRIAWSRLSNAPADAERVFLGMDGGRGCFALIPQTSDGASMRSVRDLAGQLDAGDFSAYSMARSLLDWHVRQRFCSRCGFTTTVAKGGWQRNCANSKCAAVHYPRTDPVVIMTVEWAGEGGEPQLLLGRQAGFPPGMYSALAGFVEPGETIEAAVAREVHEEAGLAVRDVRYISSQSWPFPSQLMIGCHAICDDGAITTNSDELEDARWFSRSQVSEAMLGNGPGPVSVPPTYAIAHWLIARWLAATGTCAPQ